MIPLETADPSHRVDFWGNAPADLPNADLLSYVRIERARLVRVLLRRWSRKSGLDKRDACVVQYVPEIYQSFDGTGLNVRYSFLVGPVISTRR